MTEKKKKSRRSRTKYPALDPTLNLKHRYDEISDLDYIDKLSEKEKAWLNKFMDEYVNDNLDRKNLKNNLHKTKKLKKDCDDRNNSRNRCVLTKSKANGMHISTEDLKERKIDIIDGNDVEDAIIDRIDDNLGKDAK